jgi:hypothetical protein
MSVSAFSELSEYILTKMWMSHIYQPVMIRELLIRGGHAIIPLLDARAVLFQHYLELD